MPSSTSHPSKEVGMCSHDIVRSNFCCCREAEENAGADPEQICPTLRTVRDRQSGLPNDVGAYLVHDPGRDGRHPRSRVEDCSEATLRLIAPSRRDCHVQLDQAVSDPDLECRRRQEIRLERT